MAAGCIFFGVGRGGGGGGGRQGTWPFLQIGILFGVTSIRRPLISRVLKKRDPNFEN